MSWSVRGSDGSRLSETFLGDKSSCVIISSRRVFKSAFSCSEISGEISDSISGSTSEFSSLSPATSSPSNASSVSRISSVITSRAEGGVATAPIPAAARTVPATPSSILSASDIFASETTSGISGISGKISGAALAITVSFWLSDRVKSFSAIISSKSAESSSSTLC